MAKVRVIVQVEDEVKDYIEEQSERLGVSQSGFINMCIAQYREQRESVKAMNNLSHIAYKIDLLEREMKRKK